MKSRGSDAPRKPRALVVWPEGHSADRVAPEDQGVQPACSCPRLGRHPVSRSVQPQSCQTDGPLDGPGSLEEAPVRDERVLTA